MIIVTKLSFSSRNLKTLYIDFRIAHHYDTAFANCENLEHLTIMMPPTMPKPALDAIRTSLKMNANLKKLELYRGNLVFSKDFSSEINFKLKSFDIEFYEFKPQWLSNLHSFLITQKDNLEELKIKFATVEALKTIMTMPRLKTFSLFETISIGEIEIAAESCPPNHSVTDLRIPRFSYNIKSYRSFSKVFPKVEALQIKDFWD